MSFLSFFQKAKSQSELKSDAKKFSVVIPVYSVYDKKAKTYSPPFLASRHSVALRMVTASCSDTNSLIRLYPHDYRLDHIGFFCESTGVLSSLTEKEIVVEMSNIFGELSSTGDELSGNKEDY